MNRVIRYVNAALVVIALAGLAGVWWLLWRPMPATSGTVHAGVSAQIRRDERGVPHVTAKSIEDVLFAQGYVTAQDRLWQMDALRRLAAGDMAEVAGVAALEIDTDARRLRMRHLAEAHAQRLPPADLALMKAFVRGVNASMDAQRKALPVEFVLMGYEPRPWTVSDSMLVALQMYRTLTDSWKDELQKMQLLAKGDAAKVNALFPIRSGHEVQPGSNAWAVSGKLTATGKPMLANDPHLAWTFPATWYQVHLEGGGLNAAGVSLPGLPGVIIGHNERIAWGVTNLGYDVQDLYVERANEPARQEVEVIRIKGAAPQQVTINVTRHGPIIIAEGGRPLALRWAAAELGSFTYPMVQLNMARNWTEFRDALRRYPGPGQNFVYADVDGNIGYQATGLLPVRTAHDGDLPVDGADPKFEWRGFLPFDQLPTFYNPPTGMIVTANQNPWPAEPGFRLNGEFAPQYRSNQIRARLESKKGLTAVDMLNIQTDIYAAFSHRLAREAIASYERRGSKNPSLTEPVKLLKAWDGQMKADSAAAYAVTLLYQNLRRTIAERAAPGKGGDYGFQMAPSVIENLITAKPKDWFPDWDETIVKSFDEAMAEGRRKQGDDPTRWHYGVVNEMTLGHPVLSRLPYVGRYFQIGPVELNGAATTVKQTTLRLGPSMRWVADLSNWDASLNNVVVGASGHVLSGHFRDQWPAYLAGTSFPLPFTKVEAKNTLELVP